MQTLWFFPSGSMIIFKKLNIDKSKFVLFGSNQRIKNVQEIIIRVDRQIIENVASFKCLGVIIKQNMTWNDHVDMVCTKFNQRIGIVRRIRKLIPLHAGLTQYNSLISPSFNYADFVWEDRNNVS